MDLKGKRIFGISQIIVFIAMLVLYTRIGASGMICVAGSMELFFVITYLFLGGVPNAIEYMARGRKGKPGSVAAVCKAGILYGFFAVIGIIGSLTCINLLLVENSSLLYVGKILELLMLSLPLLTILQVLRGMLQIRLNRVITAISQLFFVVCMVIGTFISYLLFNDYGNKVAALMQAVRQWHFYVVLGLVPGVIIGAIGSILFLIVIALMHRDELHFFEDAKSYQGEGILKSCFRLFRLQFLEGVPECLKHIPVLTVFFLSVEQIVGENYLFGNFYGAILPILGLVWSLLDLGLVDYKKRLYMSYRKKQIKNYYRDLKSVCCYVLLYSTAIFSFTLALHKSFLAIWSLQTYVAFMDLAAASSVIGLLGLPCIVLIDILKYRNLHIQAMVSVVIGSVISVLSASTCFKHTGAGILLYVLSCSVFLGVTSLIAAWQLSKAVGIHYLSVFIRSIGGILFSLLAGLLVFGVQNLIFTALGGLTTLLVCIFIGMLLLISVIFVLRIFDKEDLESLPFAIFARLFARFFQK